MIELTTFKDEGTGRSVFEQIRYLHESMTGKFINYDERVPEYFNPYRELFDSLSWSALKGILDGENEDERDRAYREDEEYAEERHTDYIERLRDLSDPYHN